MRAITSVHRLSAAASVVALAALGLIAAAPANAAATTLYVAQNGGNDAGNCTQAQPCATIGTAVTKASSGDTISIAAGTYPESVQVDKSLTFIGAGTSGANDTKVTGGAPPSTPASTFAVNSGTARLENLDISGNKNGLGSGVQVQPGATAVTIVNCVLADNTLDGVTVDATTSEATLRIIGSTLSGNADAGMYVRGAAAGTFPVQVTVSGSTLSGNAWEGVFAGPGTTLAIDSSVISGNHHNGGVGLLSGATLTLTASTVSANDGSGVAVNDGGILHVDTSTIVRNADTGIAAGTGSTVNVANSTIVAAAAPDTDTQQDPESPHAAVSVDDGSVSVSGTIVAGASGVSACVGALTDSGYNLDTDGSCTFRAPSVSGADPQLGTLADNGGATKTMLPAKAKGNPALDVIPAGKAGCTNKATDQRGVARPQGPKCDIGAVEVEQDPITISPSSLPDGTVGKAYSATLTASGGLGAPYVWSLADGPLPKGLSLSQDGMLSGKPTEAGTFKVTVSVDDPVTKTFTITIAAPPEVSPTAVPSSPSTTPNLANTGAHTGGLLGVALLLLGLGGAALVGARWRRRTH